MAAAVANIACSAWPHAAASSAAPSSKLRPRVAHPVAPPRNDLRKSGCLQSAIAWLEGPRPESRHLHQPALEGLTNSARTENSRHGDRNKSDHVIGGTRRRHGAAQGGGRRREVEGEEGRPSVKYGC
ncbi:hypothetical protein F511_04446 [Dorcoceras hygrometricum]|uniref:Uncharacterized protein n=1 Tax=Dorcoceras hygrometricum TaxID=472368 RepID=A0A2Z7CTA5_9LAMI|nr:hypothetical protein F511_04446 [Dorcoceras hygrometricum]